MNVVDSGSNTTASFQFDGQTNDWFYEYEGDDPTNFGVVMFGPEYAVKGTPTYNTANTILKADGGHHLLDSIITDDGSEVVVGGDLTANVISASTYFVGDLVGEASTAVSASHAVNADVAISASIASNSNNAVSASHAVNADNVVSSSHAIQADSADSATTATSASYATTAGSVDILTQDVEIRGNAYITGSLKGKFETGIPYSNNTASLNVRDYNFFEIGIGSVGQNNHMWFENGMLTAGDSKTINVKITNNTPFNPISWAEDKFKFPNGIPFTGSGAGNVDLISFVSYGDTFYGTAIENLG
jgi:hypothetical protein